MPTTVGGVCYPCVSGAHEACSVVTKDPSEWPGQFVSCLCDCHNHPKASEKANKSEPRIEGLRERGILPLLHPAQLWSGVRRLGRA